MQSCSPDNRPKDGQGRSTTVLYIQIPDMFEYVYIYSYIYVCDTCVNIRHMYRNTHAKFQIH